MRSRSPEARVGAGKRWGDVLWASRKRLEMIDPVCAELCLARANEEPDPIGPPCPQLNLLYLCHLPLSLPSASPTAGRDRQGQAPGDREREGDVPVGFAKPIGELRMIAERLWRPLYDLPIGWVRPVQGGGSWGCQTALIFMGVCIISGL